MAGADVLVKDLFALNTLVNLGFDSPHGQASANLHSASTS